jgi:protein gp37
MGQTTDIGYCDSTVNPTTGCDGCELWSQAAADKGEKQTCYAGGLHQTRMALALPKIYDPRFCHVRLAPGRMMQAASWSDLTGKDRPDKPWLNGMPRVIFIGDMGDVLSRSVPFEYLQSEIIDTVAGRKGSRHIWLMLTKQDKRLAEFGAWLHRNGAAWPKNLWAGVSITSKATEGRADWLMETRGPRIRFASVEPMRTEIDLSPWLHERYGCNGEAAQENCEECWSAASVLNWAILGGSSGDEPCDIAWIRAAKQACERAGRRVFVKQLGAHPVGRWTQTEFAGLGHGWPAGFKIRHRSGAEWLEWPEDLRVRQMPEFRVQEFPR